MRIREYIDKMIDLSNDNWMGRSLGRETDRDRILWGDPDQECTGIISTIYASIKVIEEAHRKGCNLIVVHEALFWNHGDHTDWLLNNSAFQKKAELLDRYHICVWRNHDHIHGGVKLGRVYKDGIIYGLTSLMGWNDCIVNREDVMPRELEIPQTSAREMAALINEKFRLKGVRFIGNPDAVIKKIYFPFHIQGKPSDNDIVTKINDQDINCLLTAELVDFTVSQYIKDAGELKEDKCIFALGHFNFEEIGMEWYAQYIRDHVKPDVDVYFIQAGDYYDYISR